MKVSGFRIKENNTLIFQDFERTKRHAKCNSILIPKLKNNTLSYDIHEK